MKILLSLRTCSTPPGVWLPNEFDDVGACFANASLVAKSPILLDRRGTAAPVIDRCSCASLR